MPALTFDDLLDAAPPRPSGAITFDDLMGDDKTAPAPSGAADAARGLASGLDKGIASIAGLPADFARLVTWVADQSKSKLTGTPYEQVKREADARAIIPTTTLDQYGGAAAHANSPLAYEPQTTAGKVAETVGSLAPGMLLAGPAGFATGRAFAGNAAANVAAPATGMLAAQGASSALGLDPTTSAILEGAGGLAGGIGGAIATRGGTAERSIAHAVGHKDPAVFQQAQALMDDAARMGVRLTGDEAIQQVTGGATRLGDIRRVAENSAGGGAVMKPLMAERPGQVQAAGAAVTDGLAPQALDPTQTGLRVNRAAAGEIADTQAGINAQTRPYYDAASRAQVGPHVLGALQQDPLFARTLAEVRNNPALNRTIEHLPDDAVGTLDIVQRRMREAADNARVPGQATTSNTIAANLEDARSPVLQVADMATGGPQGSYATARAQQTQLRQQQLEPLTAGPVGQLAGTEDIAAQGRALLPAAPSAGAEAGVADTVARVAARDPQAAQSLIRNHVRSAFDEATQNLASGPNQFGGSKFASIIAGNGQQAANLEAAVRALPGGDERWIGFRRFLDVMEATGQRPQMGSATAFNQETMAHLKQPRALGTAVEAAKTGGTSLIHRFREFRDQMNLGSNTAQVANLLTRPDSARVLGELARIGPDASRAPILALRLTYMGRQGSGQRAD